jgi:glutaredoxin-like protein
VEVSSEMSLIPEQHKEHIKNELAEKMENPVKLILFTQQIECPFCAQTRQLVEELASLNEKIEVEIYDFLVNSEKAKKYDVDKVPAVIISGEKDYGIRFYGVPHGYEFQTFLETILNVSRGKTNLPQDTKNKLKEINIPVHIQVFVTLTCPYCPLVAEMAYKFALESDMIKAEVIDINEFPHIGHKYGVMGVPKTVINEKIEVVGAIPEDIFLENMLLAVHSTIPEK